MLNDTTFAPDLPTPSSYGSSFLAAVRLAGFIGLTMLMVPTHFLIKRFRPANERRASMYFYQKLLKLIGFKIRVHGAITTACPAFFVANHASYLDIPVLGSVIPASFVAKAEVAGWPIFGFLTKLQSTIFIERRSTRAAAQRDQLGKLLANGENLILFPEGTSSDGRGVLPFKSSLFAVIEEASKGVPIVVQPVSIVCTAVDGLPLTRSYRPLYAWYGDMTLIPHLWNAFSCGNFTVDVVFHPIINPRDFTNRKQLAALCQDYVARGVAQGITGRGFDAPTPIALLPSSH